MRGACGEACAGAGAGVVVVPVDLVLLVFMLCFGFDLVRAAKRWCAMKHRGKGMEGRDQSQVEATQEHNLDGEMTDI